MFSFVTTSIGFHSHYFQSSSLISSCFKVLSSFLILFSIINNSSLVFTLGKLGKLLESEPGLDGISTPESLPDTETGPPPETKSRESPIEVILELEPGLVNGLPFPCLNNCPLFELLDPGL